jgi:hypothetical protein
MDMDRIQRIKSQMKQNSMEEMETLEYVEKIAKEAYKIWEECMTPELVYGRELKIGDMVRFYFDGKWDVAPIERMEQREFNTIRLYSPKGLAGDPNKRVHRDCLTTVYVATFYML